MNRWGLLALALTIIALGGALMLTIIPAPKTPIEVATSTGAGATSTAATTTPGIADLITVDPIVLSSTTAIVTGKARGSWYFEASFPIQIKNASGTVIAQNPGQAQGDWMTTDFVPFSAALTYPAEPSGSHGTAVLKNDNPSGDPAKQKEVDIPIIFI